MKQTSICSALLALFIISVYGQEISFGQDNGSSWRVPIKLEAYKNQFTVNDYSEKFPANQTYLKMAKGPDGTIAAVYVDRANVVSELVITIINPDGSLRTQGAPVISSEYVDYDKILLRWINTEKVVIGCSEEYRTLLITVNKNGEVLKQAECGKAFYEEQDQFYGLSVSSNNNIIAVHSRYRQMLYAEIFNSDLELIADSILITTRINYSSISPVKITATVLPVNSAFYVFWVNYADGGSLCYRIVNDDGSITTPEVMLQTPVGIDLSTPPQLLSLPDGGFVAMYGDPLDNYPAYLRAQYYTADGMPLGNPVVAVDSSFTGNSFVLLSLGGDTCAVILVSSYNNCNYFVFTKTGAVPGRSGQLNLGTAADVRNSQLALLSLNSEEFVLGYTSAYSYSRWIATRIFNTDFSPSPKTMPDIPKPRTSAWQFRPVAKMNDSGEVLCMWQDMRDGDKALYGQIFNSSFDPVGSNFRIDDSVAFTSDYLFVQALPMGDGSFIVCYLAQVIRPLGSSYFSLSLRKVIPGYSFPDNPEAITGTSIGYCNVGLGKNGDTIIIAYKSVIEGITFRKYSASLTPLGTEYTLFRGNGPNRFSNYFLTFGNNGSFLLMADTRLNSDYSGPGKGVIIGKFNYLGEQLSEFITPDTSVESNSRAYYRGLYLSPDGNNYFALWIENGTMMNINFGGTETNKRKLYTTGVLNSQIDPVVVSMKDNFLFYTASPNIDKYVLNYYDAELDAWWMEFLTPPIRWPALSNYGAGGDLTKFASAANDSLLFVSYADPRNTGRGMDITAKGYKIVNNRIPIPAAVKDLTKDNLIGIYPNPTRGDARVSFYVSHPYFVSITLHDILGREVMPVFSGYCEKGYYEHTLDTKSLSSGVYILRMNSFHGGVRKIVIIK